MTITLFVAIIACCFIGATLLLCAEARSRATADLVRHWPEVDGLLLASSVATVDEAGGSTWYEPRVRYEYAVGGQQLQGSRISTGPQRWRSFALAESIATRYPEGWNVVVRHDPSTPGDSVLVPVVGGSLTVIVMATLLILLGVFVAVLGIAIA